MLKINGTTFYVAATLLESRRTRFQANEERRFDKVDSEENEAIKTDLTKLIEQLALLGASMAKVAAERLLARMDDEEGVTYDTVITDYDHIDWRLIDELNQTQLFVLPRDLAAYFDPPEPLFGKVVAAKIATANEEINEAGKCLALRRPTACVFHLMRVMEIGVQKLGAKMKIAINPKSETWYQIMQHVENAIKAMPIKTSAQKTRKARYAATAAHLDGVRIAWRNEVMHPKATYTEEQAKEVFGSVRLFMRDLADLL